MGQNLFESGGGSGGGHLFRHGAIDHQFMSGLGDDDHPQYRLRGGALQIAIRIKAVDSGSETLTSNDTGVIYFIQTATTFTATMPTAAEMGAGGTLFIKNASKIVADGGGTVRLVRAPGDTLDGQIFLLCAPRVSRSLVSDGVHTWNQFMATDGIF